MTVRKARTHFIPPPRPATSRCEWCGRIPPQRKGKKGGSTTMLYTHESKGHTEFARVCTKECGKAWKQKATERVEQLDAKFIPYRTSTLTVLSRDAILRVGKEVR